MIYCLFLFKLRVLIMKYLKINNNLAFNTMAIMESGKISIFSLCMVFFLGLPIINSQSYPIQPIPFNQVKIIDDFWAPKIKQNHEVTIPIAFSQSYETGRIDNFKIAANMHSMILIFIK